MDSDAIIDIGEHYQKQSYRSRCEILSANGVSTLSANVVKQDNLNKSAVKDTLLDDSKRWRAEHRQAIVSAYRSSPFFDYYADMFIPIYEKPCKFLTDWNISFMEAVVKILRIDMPKISESYLTATDKDIDFRNSISPKPRLRTPDADFVAKPYYQVFSEKHPFAPNLSIIDLLFCEGNNAKDYL